MKKLIALLLAVLMLSGCQLASEEKNESQMQDKMVGIFVTFDPLNLGIDLESYIRDNGGITDGEMIMDTERYQNRLYAELDEDGCWYFPGYEGLYMGQAWQEDHWAGFSTEGFCDRKTHVTQTDTHDGIEETGTVYIPSDGDEFILNCNPVYMTPDGEYYTVQGDSFHAQPKLDSSKMTVSAQQTLTEDDGVEYVYSASFAVEVKSVAVAEQVVIIQMSADHTELSREEYTPDTMPETVTPDDGAAYLIVEEYTADAVRRTLNNPGDDPIEVFARTEQVYCIPRYTEVSWPE